MILFTKERISLFFFFLFFFVLGITIFKDFGMSWDEVTSRNNGIVSLNYIATLFNYSVTEHFGNIAPLHEYFDKDYGVAFELPMAFFEYVFNIHDTQNIFYLRHFFTYLIFLFAAYSIYEMSSRRFDNWIIGLFSASIFILSPRIFAEAFYNDKDIVFMSAFAIAMNYNIKFLLTGNLKNALLASFFTAFAIDVRIMGIIIPVVTFTIIIINLCKDRAFFQKKFTLHLFYLISLVFFIILMWPWLWEDPIKNFILAFKNMAQFRWEGMMFFNGSYIKSTQLPWYYAPTWIAITTPPIYLIFFVIGSLKVIWRLIVNNYRLWNNDKEMQDYLFLGLFISPLLAVIVLNSVLYDSWRQLYFLYPAFILVSTHGALAIWNISKKSIKYISLTLIVVCILNTIVTMWSMHPLQNVYFNFFAGTNLKSNWELDYWGLSNRKALEYILAHDDRRLITVHALSATPLERSFLMLMPEEKSRIKLVPNKENADYLVDNFRGNRGNVFLDKSIKDSFSKYYSIKYKDETILDIYKSNSVRILLQKETNK